MASDPSPSDETLDAKPNNWTYLDFYDHAERRDHLHDLTEKVDLRPGQTTQV